MRVHLRAVHYYNRNLPYDAVTKETDTASVTGPTNNQVYTNPRYMVNIVTGASGDKEGETVRRGMSRGRSTGTRPSARARRARRRHAHARSFSRSRAS